MMVKTNIIKEMTMKHRNSICRNIFKERRKRVLARIEKDMKFYNSKVDMYLIQMYEIQDDYTIPLSKEDEICDPIYSMVDSLRWLISNLEIYREYLTKKKHKKNG